MLKWILQREIRVNCHSFRSEVVCFGLNYEDVFCFVTRMDSLGALVTLLWQMPAGNPQ